MSTLAIVVPVTATDRDWPNHVPLAGEHGLPDASWAMTEQVRTVSRSRLTRTSGVVAPECLTEIRRWLTDFLTLS